MGSDNLFKKRKDERKKRRENNLKQKSSKWLIVCEGVQTEPNYFKGAINSINSLITDEECKLKADIVGEGMNTISLVNSVDDILYEIDKYKKTIVPYGKIFVVFDKDSFNSDNFNNAILMCIKKGYIPLWSNQAIEYWFLLHFNYIDSQMDRNDYKNKINEYFKVNGYNYNYKKNDKDIYNKLTKYGSLDRARKNALKVHTKHLYDAPSASESCTTVYKFFDEVDERLKELE